MKAPPNARKVILLTITDNGSSSGTGTFVKIENAVIGPISADQAMADAAHLAVAASAAGSSLKLGDLIKAILKEQAK